MSHNCVFCKIANKELPARLLYEDEEVLAFHDIHPLVPVHFLIIPKLHISSLQETQALHQALLGKILLLAPQLVREQGCEHGFRTIINTGDVGGQEVAHLHLHVLSGACRLPAMLAKLDEAGA
jgi:histidine triad (HIT) family protein